MPIYCDEAGATGYNLLEKNQPYFVYAAINVEEQEAKDFCDFLQKKYFLQGRELKAVNLVKSKNGQLALKELYDIYSKKAKAIYFHKKYSLACKFYEYVFEPIVADKSSFFYQKRFHQFIANLLYVSFNFQNDEAEIIFKHFQELLLGNNEHGLYAFLQNADVPNELVSFIAGFTVVHREQTMEEIAVEGKYDKWILDLGLTGLYSLLCEWAVVERKPLNVICDNSKSLQEAIIHLPQPAESNYQQKYWDPTGAGSVPILYALEAPIVFKNSKEYKGIQLADLFASSIGWVLNHLENPFAKLLTPKIDEVVAHRFSVRPQPEMFLKPGSAPFEFGRFTLHVLAELSLESKENVLDRYFTFLQSYLATMKE